jgi:hypothetical protein
MRAWRAVVCLAIVLAGLTFPFFWRSISLYAIAPMEYPLPVLEQKAREISTSFGINAHRQDWESGFQKNREAMDYIEKNRGAMTWADAFRAVPPVEVWYRQSPEYISSPPDGVVRARRPGYDTPGMLYVLVDSSGRLRQFEAIVPRHATGVPAPVAVDPAAVFTAAGLDYASFREVTPAYAPVLAFDSRDDLQQPGFRDRPLAQNQLVHTAHVKHAAPVAGPAALAPRIAIRRDSRNPGRPIGRR